MFLIVFLIVLVIDQLSKFLVQVLMYEMQSIPVIPHVFYLTYIQNPGAAFGMLAHRTWLFIGVTVFAVLLTLFFYFLVEKEKFWLRLGLALMCGGAVGNLIDRIRLGKVVDFLDFQVWPVFNLADSAIVIGVGLICWQLLKPSEEKRRLEG